MTLLEDAQRLADLYPITEAGSHRFHDQGYCGVGSDCPHFALPKIIAVLKAAQALVDSVRDFPDFDSRNMTRVDVGLIETLMDAMREPV